MGHELSMYFRGVSCIYGWVSTGYSETYHYMASYCIAYHPIIHSWWLYVSFGVWKILNVDFLYWWNLNSKCNIYICRSMRHTGYTWFRTHTTLVALFVVQIRFRVGAHLVEQIESGLKFLELWWAAWLFRGPHLPLSFTYSVIQYSDRISLMLDLPFSFRLASYFRSSCTHDTISWVVLFFQFSAFVLIRT